MLNYASTSSCIGLYLSLYAYEDLRGKSRCNEKLRNILVPEETELFVHFEPLGGAWNIVQTIKLQHIYGIKLSLW